MRTSTGTTSTASRHSAFLSLGQGVGGYRGALTVADGRVRTRVTARQDMLLVGATDRRSRVDLRARGHAGQRPDTLRSLSIACVALPTCSKALGEADRCSRRGRPPRAARRHRQRRAALRLNMTGCPNGCARPYGANSASSDQEELRHLRRRQRAGRRLAELRADAAGRRPRVTAPPRTLHRRAPTIRCRHESSAGRTRHFSGWGGRVRDWCARTTHPTAGVAAGTDRTASRPRCGRPTPSDRT